MGGVVGVPAGVVELSYKRSRNLKITLMIQIVYTQNIFQIKLRKIKSIFLLDCNEVIRLCAIIIIMK